MLARDLGVTLHTIAVGRVGGAPRGFDPQRERIGRRPSRRPQRAPCLKSWRSLRADARSSQPTRDALGDVFRTIDALEKSPVRGQVLTRYDEHYAAYAGIALSLLARGTVLASRKVGAIAMKSDCSRSGKSQRVSKRHSSDSVPVMRGGPVMGFARPELLWLLTILVPLSIWTIRGRWRRRKRWQSLAQRGRPTRDGTPGIVAAIVCLIIALAQPRWGHLPGSALPPGHDLVLLIDVSRSMAAEDAVPNRLAVAVEMAESLVRPLGRDPSNRAAVVAFAGRGVLRCPLTENLGAVLDALRSTAARLGQARRDRPGGCARCRHRRCVGVDRQEHAQGRAIVIFSDGEDHADRWRSRIERLRQQDIVVHAVSIGDASERPSRTG